MGFLDNTDWTTVIVTLVLAFFIIPIGLHIIGNVLG